MATPDELRLTLPAAHSVEAKARAALRQHALDAALPEDELTLLEFVASELVSNAVDHGGGLGVREEADSTFGAQMHLRLRVAGGEWILSVADMGGGDPEVVRQHIASGEEPDVEGFRGRGLYLLAQMLDRLEVERSRDGRGLQFTASKRWGASA